MPVLYVVQRHEGVYYGISDHLDKRGVAVPDFLRPDTRVETHMFRDDATPPMEVAPEAIAECPTCGSVVALDAKECPSCGEQFEDEAEPAITSPSGQAAADVDEDARSGPHVKFLFYTGILLILLGGPGIALFSWLHDVLRISVLNYNDFDTFGPVNRLVAAVGLIVMIVGIVLFILSLRLGRPSEVDLELPEARDV